ncbi:uncharacterized protein LOC115709589 [Cannabis sativa]|uniref:uncharacterized protein LOC115709589 n=1 Tax=Cannabis sativa TaxID=3483 RepID=UPI0029CA7F2A|nr:uncharacterized protein LOC115709589 [Cannabis sativa]
MSSLIISSVGKLLKVSMLVSLSVQSFLLVLAPIRKWSRSNLIAWSVWGFYLVADWIAATIIGQIIKSNDTKTDDHYSLWASFLLMHLGGPDTITSLSLEDNELWIRHLFGLILQVLSAVFTLFRRGSKNRLLWPNILVFIVGVIKFGERTWALRLASLKKFGETNLPDPNPGPDYKEAEQLYSTVRPVQVQGTITEMMASAMSGGVSNYGQHSTDEEESNKKDFDEMKLLQEAYTFFGTFKGLIVGFLLSSKDREWSRSYFFHENAARAFRLVEYELCFMYQVLHTKALVIHGKLGYSLRFITICSTVLAFLVFLFIEKKHGFGNFENCVTYALFIGAIVLETFSAVKLMFLDWVLLAFKDSWFIKHVPNMILRRKRWSKSVSQMDIIGHCLQPEIKFENLVCYLHKYGVSKLMKRMLYNFSYRKAVDKDLEIHIFEETKNKSKKAISLRDAMEACSQRGEAALLQNSSSYIKLKWSIGEYQYAESLLLWHLATELCYNDQANSTEEDQSFSQLFAQRFFDTCICQGHQEEEQNANDQQSSGIDYKNICQLISKYMFYLLIEKSDMLAPVLGNWNIVFADTCEEARRFFDKHKISCHGKACWEILSMKPKVRSRAVKGERSKSVLFDACILAQQLQNEESQWKIMSGVWVEMLSYAAINCTPFFHAKQLSKGGELLTFTWLIMNHLGLGTQFAEQEQQAGTKMDTII